MAAAVTQRASTQTPVAAVGNTYVWELPVRLFHWINAACIATLFVTGLLIGRAMPLGGGEPYRTFTFGWVRYVHFTAAYVFLANWLFRIYWFFVGNAQARNIFAFWSRRAWKSALKEARELALASPHESQPLPNDNHLARMAHGLLFTASMFMLLTGFALYAEAHPDGTWGHLSGWLVGLVGATRPLRLWHHVVAWFFPIFVIAHLYQVIRVDALARQGLISSMFSGYYLCRLANESEQRSRRHEVATVTMAGGRR
ncbi:Ni/Fe-hydrogenase, b-type cytochrome subunit [Carboxydochorda subterranea]|uniref:Ni/Fe-hydrogenase, b-type cytochrome subunit n=1 Tax=Carboxydichorda subterranea TaxID=3109565 RepID=A0ABZ1BWL8_9FIRM|nr:Ni/Fe-hydrogenase, b-type cytochrome subunit [Limnochorda sp. L945t]WRP16522.1 Ni/Fe-hydrogenase, b-type cytochrome subunit [Limnochorda sp. L945t]